MLLSLAVWARMQLNAQIDSDSCQDKGNAIYQFAAELAMGSPDRDLDSGNHCPSKTISSQIENCSTLKPKHKGCEAGDMGDSPPNQMNSENVNNAVVQVEISGDEMEVDLASMCISAPQLVSACGKMSIGLFIENGEVRANADPSTTKNLPCTGIELKNLDGVENLEKNCCASMVEAEPQSIDNLLVTDNSLDSHTRLQIGASKSGAGTEISSPALSESKIDKHSPLMSKPVSSNIGFPEVSSDMDENREDKLALD